MNDDWSLDDYVDDVVGMFGYCMVVVIEVDMEKDEIQISNFRHQSVSHDQPSSHSRRLSSCPIHTLIAVHLHLPILRIDHQ